MSTARVPAPFLVIGVICLLGGSLHAQDPDFDLLVNPASLEVCSPSDAVYSVEAVSLFGYMDPVTLATNGEPAGSTVLFGNNPLVPTDSSMLTISGLGGAAPGDYLITVVGIAPTSTHSSTVSLLLFDAVPDTAVLISPPNGAGGVALLPQLVWNASSQAALYQVQLSEDAGFGTPLLNLVTAATDLQLATSLLPNHTYYWRVLPENGCGAQSAFTPFSFTTGNRDPQGIPILSPTALALLLLMLVMTGFFLGRRGQGPAI